MAEILRVDPLDPDHAAIARAAACLRRGGLVAFPTETVYGLGADATSRAAVRRIFDAKGRPADDPLIVHVATLDAVRPLVSSLPDVAVQLAEKFWPGPLTLVLHRSAAVNDDVTAGLDTVAVRIPAHPVARALISAAAIPVAAPSANPFSRPSPTRAEHVAAELGDRVDLILDAGPSLVGLESTVLDLTSSPPVVLRPGGVSTGDLRQVLPLLISPTHSTLATTGPMASPGLLMKHYAPSTPLTLFEGGVQAVTERLATEMGAAIRTGERVVILGSHERIHALREHVSKADRPTPFVAVDLGSEDAPAEMAARLYVALRECDHAGADRILAAQISSEEGIRLALRDRLRRASAGHIVGC